MPQFTLRQKGALIGLGMLFAVSLIVFLVVRSPFTEYLMYFPNSSEGGLAVEKQYLPTKYSLYDRISEYLNEIILGPVNLLSKPLLNAESRVQSIFLSKNNSELMVSFTSNVMLNADGTKANAFGTETRKVLVKDIKANFPGIQKIFLLIDGQIPDFPAYYSSAQQENSSNSKKR
jgi:hypothetical protein